MCVRPLAWRCGPDLHVMLAESLSDERLSLIDLYLTSRRYASSSSLSFTHLYIKWDRCHQKGPTLAFQYKQLERNACVHLIKISQQCVVVYYPVMHIAK